ncbi:2-aminoadipate transaminase-like [Babylonia areolata]|uniref:2-aminoadipate transaminase-like n=1 Tax=Babylonia areolata TaxID=304850 RepID=UPI003FCF9159
MEEETTAALMSLEEDSTVPCLANGSPGPETLQGLTELLRTATARTLGDQTDIISLLDYGPERGDAEFREQLAAFLSRHYGDTVTSDNLMVTCGAMLGLRLILTTLCDLSCPVFVEDPTFWGALSMLRHDLHVNVIPAPCDDDGLDTEALDRLLTAHRPKPDEERTKKPFWAMVYTIPVFNNPTGRCHSAARCRRLVELARQHDVLVVAEDVYNLLHFGEEDGPHPPPRLLTYDHPWDPEHRGHVLSNCTFSKLLAPGLRLGWVEGPDSILRHLHGSELLKVGGSLNHYTSRLISTALKLGLIDQHLKRVRMVYKRRMEAVCRVLRNNLPRGATFFEPQGGLFVWVVFPPGCDTEKMLKWTSDRHRLTFLPGISTSPGGRHGHCTRVSISFYPEHVLVDLVSKLCRAATEFFSLHASV